VERTYDVRQFISAYFHYVQWRHHENELGEYHLRRYRALSTVFGVDLELEDRAQQDLDRWVFLHLVRRGAAMWASAQTPFSGMSEAPPRVGRAMGDHSRRLGEISNAMQAELFEMACTAYEGAFGRDERVIPEGDLRAFGFNGGDEPNPIDFD
jgi:hypothetical protein